MNREFDDIIDVVYPTPSQRPRMSMRDRAAQFAPFAALTGFDAVIEESVKSSENNL